MKKRVFIIVFIAICFVLFYVCFNEYISEIPSRLAKFHNTGTITIVVDGDEADLTNYDISYIDEMGKTVETSKIENNNFKFKEGLYGFNKFVLKIPHSELGEIKIEFGQFNTNRWHVCKYDILVDITTNNDGTVFSKMKKTLLVEGTETKYEVSKTLDKNDNVISDLKDGN